MPYVSLICFCDSSLVFYTFEVFHKTPSTLSVFPLSDLAAFQSLPPISCLLTTQSILVSRPAPSIKSFYPSTSFSIVSDFLVLAPTISPSYLSLAFKDFHSTSESYFIFYPFLGFSLQGVPLTLPPLYSSYLVSFSMFLLCFFFVSCFCFLCFCFSISVST